MAREGIACQLIDFRSTYLFPRLTPSAETKYKTLGCCRSVVAENVSIRGGLEDARPLRTFRSCADPLLAFYAPSSGSFAVGSGFPCASAFLAVSQHTRAVRPHALAYRLLSRARCSRSYEIYQNEWQ